MARGIMVVVEVVVVVVVEVEDDVVIGDTDLLRFSLFR